MKYLLKYEIENLINKILIVMTNEEIRKNDIIDIANLEIFADKDEIKIIFSFDNIDEAFSFYKTITKYVKIDNNER